METVIFCSGTRFPIPVLAGAIYLRQLPSEYKKGVIWSSCYFPLFNKYRQDCIYSLGKTAGGSRVLAFSSSYGNNMLKNLIHTFLEMHNTDRNDYRIVEINLPGCFMLNLGYILLKVPLVCIAGKKIIERSIKKIYPKLTSTVKLDCHFQISDNYTEKSGKNTPVFSRSERILK
ncbi:MAG: DUF3189 family protein [Bacillota bacterium]